MTVEQVRIGNPYAALKGQWITGLIHAHVNAAVSADGTVHVVDSGTDPLTIYKFCQSRDLNFAVLVADVTESSGLNCFGRNFPAAHEGVVGIPGREIQNDSVSDCFNENGAEYLHILTLGHGGPSIVAHPNYFADVPGVNWREQLSSVRFPIAGGKLEALDVCGLEVFNSFENLESGGGRKHAYADQWWDALLEAGHYTLGFAANDLFARNDQALHSNLPLGFMCVSVNDPDDERDIVESLSSGQSYASTGVRLEDAPLKVRRHGEGVSIDVVATSSVDWIAKVFASGSQSVDAYERDNSAGFSFEHRDPWRFIRIECRDPVDGSKAWLQPLQNLSHLASG